MWLWKQATRKTLETFVPITSKNSASGYPCLSAGFLCQIFLCLYMSYRLSFFLPPIGLSSVRSVSVSFSIRLSVDYTSFCMSVWLILAQSVLRQISLIKLHLSVIFLRFLPILCGESLVCISVCTYTSSHLSVNFSLLAYLSVSSLTERTCKIPKRHSSCLQIGHFQKQVTGGEPWMCYCSIDIYHIERVPHRLFLKRFYHTI